MFNKNHYIKFLIINLIYFSTSYANSFFSTLRVSTPSEKVSYVEIIQPKVSDINIDLSLIKNIGMNDEGSYKDNVKGIQFDVFYDVNQLKFSQLLPLVKGAVFEHLVYEEEGRVKCIMFYLDGSSIKDSDLSRLADISFSQVQNFYGQTDVYIDNVIVAGKFGKDISPFFSSSAWRVDFIDLKPFYSYMHKPQNIVFSDSINISYQLYKDGNVRIDIYDIFNQKVKSILDQYMEIGRYTFKVDNYNEFDEELDYGRYKIDFSTDHEYRDSLYIIYEEVYD